MEFAWEVPWESFTLSVFYTWGLTGGKLVKFDTFAVRTFTKWSAYPEHGRIKYHNCQCDATLGQGQVRLSSREHPIQNCGEGQAQAQAQQQKWNRRFWRARVKVIFWTSNSWAGWDPSSRGPTLACSIGENRSEKTYYVTLLYFIHTRFFMCCIVYSCFRQGLTMRHFLDWHFGLDQAGQSLTNRNLHTSYQQGCD